MHNPLAAPPPLRTWASALSMWSRSADQAFSTASALPARRAYTLPSWIGFVADFARATIAACAVSVGVLLLLAYLAGAGAAG